MNTEPPSITTIIPTFRRPHLLKRSINSVLRQTYPHLQVCVYDNASGDETEQVVADLAKKDSRVKYHCHVENIGVFRNFIYGMDHVDTPFFSFLSDDDLLLPHFYEIAMDGFEKFPDAVLSAGSTIIMTETGKVLDVSLLSWSREGYFSPPEGMFEMADGNSAWTSILFRKKVISEMGLLDAEVGGSADYDFQLRAAIRFPIVISKTPCAIFVSSETSTGGKAKFDHFWPGWQKIHEKIYTDERIPLSTRKKAVDLLSKILRKVLIVTAAKSITQGDSEDVIKISGVLRQHFKNNCIAFLLLNAGRLCKIPGVHQIIAFVDRLRRKLRMTGKKNSQLNLEYGGYAKWLTK